MKLSNEIISVEVAPHGAELVSLVKGRREYMWCGDAQYWNRHAPILFPAVGKPFNNEIRIDGQVFTMKQHGFARDIADRTYVHRVSPGEKYSFTYSIVAL